MVCELYFSKAVIRNSSHCSEYEVNRCRVTTVANGALWEDRPPHQAEPGPQAKAPAATVDAKVSARLSRGPQLTRIGGPLLGQSQAVPAQS